MCKIFDSVDLFVLWIAVIKKTNAFFSKFQAQLNAEFLQDCNDIKNSFSSKMSVNGFFTLDN